jgi:hypothetical protein
MGKDTILKKTAGANTNGDSASPLLLTADQAATLFRRNEIGSATPRSFDFASE